MALAIAVFLGASPGTASICDRLFELAAADGPEETQGVTREQCEGSYERRREDRGFIGFARLGWCVRGAATLLGAARC
jgi:hypothetical protein